MCQELDANQQEAALAGENALIHDKLRELQQHKGHMDVAHDVLADHLIKHYAYQILAINAHVFQ